MCKYLFLATVDDGYCFVGRVFHRANVYYYEMLTREM